MIVTWRRTYFDSLMIWIFGIILKPFSLLFKTESRVHRFCGSKNFTVCFCLFLYILIPFFIIFNLNYKIFKIAQIQRLKIAVNPVSSDTSQSRNPSSINSVFFRWRITRELKNIKTHGIIIGVLICCILQITICVAPLVQWVMCPFWGWTFIWTACWSKLDGKSIYLWY